MIIDDVSEFKQFRVTYTTGVLLLTCTNCDIHLGSWDGRHAIAVRFDDMVGSAADHACKEDTPLLPPCGCKGECFQQAHPHLPVQRECRHIGGWVSGAAVGNVSE